jgi:hypothetical protein
MAENIFLKPTEFYQRRINPIAQYVEQNSFYLHKMTGMPLEDTKKFVLDGIRSNKFEGQRDPVVTFFERNEHQDREKHQGKLSHCIQSIVKNEEILAPTFTTYLPTSKKKSILVGFIDNNVKIRSKAKKEAQKAQAENKTDLYIMKNNEQDNRKRYNNSMSGAFGAQGSIMSNPTAHSTLTSITRTVSSMGNSSNEKIISGNRHYRNADIVLANVISITSSLDKFELESVMTKYYLHYPTVDEVMSCIYYSSDLYGKDPKAFSKVIDFVKTLDPIERAAFVYTGDLYHLRVHNESFVRSLLLEMSKKITDVQVNEPFKVMKNMDELIVNYGHQACLAECRGIGKDYSKLSEKDLNTVAATCLNIESTVLKYKDLISALFLTRNVPASTAFIPNMVRRTVVLSDTDSTMFSLDEWVNWHRGSIVFDDEAFAFAGSVMFIATQCIAHCLALFSANMNVERDKLFLLAMKPEFVFPVHCQTSVAKHYFASKSVKEGNVFVEMENEIKGVNLKSSAAPKSIIDSSQAKMVEIMDKIFNGQKISLVEELKRVAGIERKITSSLLNGDVEFYKQSKIKAPEAYSRGPMESPYQHHDLWQTVFAPKYNSVEEPIYSVIKVPTIMDNKTGLKNWLDAMRDRELAERMTIWLAKYGKTSLPTMYLSTQYVKSYGIPEEIKSVISVKKIILDLTGTDRMILETLGYFTKDGWLLSEMSY